MPPDKIYQVPGFDLADTSGGGAMTGSRSNMTQACSGDVSDIGFIESESRSVASARYQGKDQSKG